MHIYQNNLSLERALDEFKKKYGSKITIEDGSVDITDCFFNIEKNKYEAPYSYGDLNENYVYSYILYGAPFVQKFKKNEKGKPVFNLVTKGYERVDLTNDMIVLASMCLKPMKNTSFHEMYDGLKNVKGIQGFKRRVLNKVVEKIKSEYIFDPDKDTMFIFSGSDETIENAINLNKIWMKQAFLYGAKMLDFVESDESDLIKTMFNCESDKMEAMSYFPEKPWHVPESVEFLKRKCELVKKI